MSIIVITIGLASSMHYSFTLIKYKNQAGI